MINLTKQELQAAVDVNKAYIIAQLATISTNKDSTAAIVAIRETLIRIEELVA